MAAQFQFAAQLEQSLEVFAPVDAVEITGQTAQAPDVQTVIRQQVIDRICSGFFAQTSGPVHPATVRDKVRDPLHGVERIGQKRSRRYQMVPSG